MNIAPQNKLPVIPPSCVAASRGTQLWLKAQTSAATTENYMRHVVRLIQITGKQPEVCTLDDLLQFVNVLKNLPASAIGMNKPFKKQPSPASINAIIQAIKSLYSFMHKAGVITFNPAVMIRTTGHVKRKHLNMAFAQDFVTKCAALATNSTFSEKERIAGFAVLVFASTGLRASEAGNALMSDIFFEDNQPWLTVIGKGAKKRDVVLIPSLLKIRNSFTDDKKYLIPEKLRGSGGRLVVWRMVKRAAVLVGIDANEIHPHLLRHFHASILLNSGASLTETRDNLGHGNISVTSQYLHTDAIQRHQSISNAFQTKFPEFNKVQQG